MSMIASSEYMTLTQAAKLIPGRPHLSTVHRWGQHGVKGVKLETLRAGSRVFTTREAVETFLAELNTTDDDRLKAEGC